MRAAQCRDDIDHDARSRDSIIAWHVPKMSTGILLQTTRAIPPLLRRMAEGHH